MAHWLDIGGTLGGMTTDIYSEGLQIPILKYQDRGVVNQTVVDIIRQNVRLPSRAMGDLRAQVTAVKTGERRFLQLLDRYGRDAVLDFDRRHHGPRRGDGARAHAHHPGRRLRGRILHGRRRHRHRQAGADPRARHRQGRRDDGRPERGVEAGARLLQFGHHHRLRLRAGRLQVHHLADRLSDQRRLVPQPQDHRAAGPRDQRGAAGADALVDDLSDDDRRHDLQGAGAGDPRPRDRRPSCRPAGVVVPRHQHRTSEFFIGSFGPLGGGWGAKRNEDGVSGTVCINDGDTHNSPNEQAEFKFPIVVERYALVPDSGGAGRRRGGLGVERVVRARTNMMVNNQSDRAHCRPWGLDGGLDGTGNAVEMRIGGQWKTDFPNAKVLVAQLKPGDAFRSARAAAAATAIRSTRPVEQVREDVRQGYVTRDSGGRALRRRDRSADVRGRPGGDREAARARGARAAGGAADSEVGVSVESVGWAKARKPMTAPRYRSLVCAPCPRVFRQARVTRRRVGTAPRTSVV